MAQFCVHRNANPATRLEFPLLLDVQNDLVAGLETRVVVPLRQLQSIRPIRGLTPVLELDEHNYVVLTPQLAGIPKRLLGPQVADLSERRDEILAAIDLLLTGI